VSHDQSLLAHLRLGSRARRRLESRSYRSTARRRDERLDFSESCDLAADATELGSQLLDLTAALLPNPAPLLFRIFADTMADLCFGQRFLRGAALAIELGL
jgi:hypothetical protein